MHTLSQSPPWTSGLVHLTLPALSLRLCKLGWFPRNQPDKTEQTEQTGQTEQTEQTEQTDPTKKNALKQTKTDQNRPKQTETDRNRPKQTWFKKALLAPPNPL